MTTTPVRFGLLFPTANADARDFSSLLSRAAPGATLGVVELSWPTGTHSGLGAVLNAQAVATMNPSILLCVWRSRSGLMMHPRSGLDVGQLVAGTRGIPLTRTHIRVQ